MKISMGMREARVRNASAAFLLFCLGAAPVSSEERAWTPTDSVAVRYFSLSQSESDTWDLNADLQPIVASPSGKYFFFLSHHGDLPSDSNIYSLEAFRAQDVTGWLSQAHPQSNLAPYRSLTRRSYSSSLPAIRDAQWGADSRSIFFQAMTEAGALQVFRWEMNSGTVTQLTRHPHPIQWIGPSGDCLLFQDVEKFVPPMPTYPVEWPEQDAMGRVVIPSFSSYLKARRAAYVTCRGDAARVLENLGMSHPWLAQGAPLAAAVSLHAPSHFVIINLERGAETELFSIRSGQPFAALPGGKDTPGKYKDLPEAAALWSEDSSHVMLVNAVVLEESDTQGREPAEGRFGAIVDYSVASGEVQVLEPLVGPATSGQGSQFVKSVSWLKPGREVLVSHETAEGTATKGTVYIAEAGGWRSTSVDPSVQPASPQHPSVSGLSVTLRQGVNDPPHVVVSDGRHERTLTAPDPALRNVLRARIESFQWTVPSDRTLEGGLALPRDGQPGRKFPLVIQAYRYRPDLFLPDGVNSSGYAVQPLVARGIAVLQMPINSYSERGFVGHEGPTFVKRIDAAVQQLAQRGLIDPKHVGLIGFSRAGFQVYYAITHPGTMVPAAAICADSLEGTYSEYLATGALIGPSALGEYEETPGGTFWQKKLGWLDSETSFNVDRVRTPVLFTWHHGGRGEPYDTASQELLGAFELNRKPIELLFFPQGDHELKRPRERLAVLEAVIDWMSFWLEGYEDPSPQKAQQYNRWRPMRAMLQQKGAASGSARAVDSDLD